MTEGWKWKTRCPESGYMVGECACQFCYQDDQLDIDEYSDWIEEELELDFDWSEEYDEEDFQDDEDAFWTT